MPTLDDQINNTLKRINEKRSTIYIQKSRQFNIDDCVLVDWRNLQVTAGNNRLLTCKWLAPHEVIKAICEDVELF